jgi:hypothetical protein
MGPPAIETAASLDSVAPPIAVVQYIGPPRICRAVMKNADAGFG